MRKILLLLLVCFGALKALSQIKVVPFIYYVPVDFERNLRGSFLFNPTRPCFIKQNNKLYLYSNYQNDKFEYKEMNIKKIYLLSLFLKIVHSFFLQEWIMGTIMVSFPLMQYSI